MLFQALLSTALAGGLYLLLLFFLCAAGVIGFKYAQLWLRKNKEGQNPKESEQKPAKEKKQDAGKKPAESKPKAVYYIVEKKRARAKPSYSEPKKIKFE